MEYEYVFSKNENFYINLPHIQEFVTTNVLLVFPELKPVKNTIIAFYMSGYSISSETNKQ